MAEGFLPIPTEVSRAFWDGLKDRTLRIQRCVDCGHWIHYPREHCPKCFSANVGHEVVSGNGTLYTFTIARVPTLAEFKDQMPQLLGVVELDEGVRINTVIEGVPEGELAIGMRVAPAFVTAGDGETVLLHFTKAE